ncbi:MAG: LysM peptidoglycan-binding domain-containing protein, partial [Anaerolineaceae bacterium]
TPTNTPTITETPTITPTFTPSAPFEYVVQEDDNCQKIADKYAVDVEVLMYLNNLDSSCIIHVGATILVPAPGQELPTATPLPTDIKKGTVIDYTVRSGDTLEGLAKRFNSTVEKIVYETNRYRRTQDLAEIEDNNDLYIGDLLKIPVNLVTPVPTATATRTMTPSPTP